jgi:2-keto-4-pentenoate hydratase
MNTEALIAALAAGRRGGPQLHARDWGPSVRHLIDAYSVQDNVAQQLGWSAATPAAHWKAGAPARTAAVTAAPLDPHWVRAIGQPCPALPWPLLGLEAEVALRLGRSVTPEQARDLRPEAAGAWVQDMCIAVECVASRWAEALAAPELLRMADHQSHGALLLGPWQPYRPLDWARMAWRLSQPGSADAAGIGGHSLADPAWLLPGWLQHLTRRGDTVPAGTVVTTGAWGGLHPLSAAARAGAPLGLSFAGLGELTFSVPASSPAAA